MAVLYDPHLPSKILGVFKKIENLLARVFAEIFLAEAGAGIPGTQY
jgi:hypothetical protein